MSVKIWETPTWKGLIKELLKSAEKSVKSLDKIENPLIDPTLLNSTKEFLSERLPELLKGNPRDFFVLIEGLSRKVVPIASAHYEAARQIYENFFGSLQGDRTSEFYKNNVEFLRKIVFCLEEPIDTDTSLSDQEFRVLERLVNAFSDRLKFNPNRQDLAVREDLIVAAFRKQGIISGAIPRVLKKVAKFAGLSVKKGKFYDPKTGREKTGNYYYLLPEFEQFLDELGLIEHGRDVNGKNIKYLSQEIPVEILYCFIQGWRAVNLEPDVLGEYLINGICNLLAYTLLLSLPEGNVDHSGQIEQSQALLSDESCHNLIISLSKLVAYVIHGDSWLSAIWTSPKKSKYHRSVRYVIVGNIIRIQQGLIYLNNNVMTQYVRNYVVRVSTTA